MQRENFISSLKKKTIEFLVKSKPFAKKLEEIPKSTLAKAISRFPQLLANLPQYYPAWGLTQRLVNDKEFLSLIPVKVHAYLAATKFRHQISSKVVRKLLQVYPDLPAYLTPRGQFLNRHYFKNQRFLSSLSCSVFLTLSNNPRFVNRLEEMDLAGLAKNVHMWKCLPVGIIRKMMKKTNIGSKMKIGDIIIAAKTMSKSQSLDRDVVGNLLQY